MKWIRFNSSKKLGFRVGILAEHKRLKKMDENEMGILEAFEILENLSKGASPFTGKQYSKKNGIRIPKIQQALKIATQCLYDHEDMREQRYRNLYICSKLKEISYSPSALIRSWLDDEEC